DLGGALGRTLVAVGAERGSHEARAETVVDRARGMYTGLGSRRPGAAAQLERRGAASHLDPSRRPAPPGAGLRFVLLAHVEAHVVAVENERDEVRPAAYGAVLGEALAAAAARIHE